MLITDILIVQKGVKNRYISLKPAGELVMRIDGHHDEVIGSDIAGSFDACIDENGILNVFTASSKGTLLHFRKLKDRWQGNVVLESKSRENKIKNIRVLRINSKFHLFYCVDYSERLLVHHIAEDGDYSMQPEVIDYIGRRFVYDIAPDHSGNLHILYTGDGTLMHRMYKYSAKSYTPPQKVTESDILCISSVCTGDTLYTAYISSERGGRALNLCDTASGRIRAVATGIQPRSECSVYGYENSLKVQWLENSMAFEARATPELEISKPSALGKCSGMYRLKLKGASNTADRCLCNLHGEPFDMRLKEIPMEKNQFKPKGYEVDDLSQKYIDVLKAKADEIRERDFKESMARIEASLGKLVSIAEKILVNGNNTDCSEYNEKKDTDNREE